MRFAAVSGVIASSLLGMGPASAADTFGAIAYSQANGAHGYGYKARSRDAAEEKALQECGPSCKVVIWFRNSCAALAVGKGRGYGTFWSAAEDAVLTGAMRECRKNTSACELTRMVCSSY
jgi:serine/threonine-protein kinase